MELYDMMKNIRSLNNEQELVKSISVVKKTLFGLTEERTCKIYGGYLLNELRNRHIPARLINTLDLGLSYEHVFILVPSNDKGYFISDLTFSQFKNDELNQLCIQGYQLIDDEIFNYYLNIIDKNSYFYCVDDVFHSRILNELSKKR